MKYIVIICLIFWSCTDDRDLDTNEFEARPSFEINVFQTQYSAELINAGNDSIPIPSRVRDFIDVDFLNEQFNADFLERLEFKFLAENTIDRRLVIDFIFFDDNDSITYRVIEPIEAGTVDMPTLKSFSVELNPQEVDIITSSIRAEIFVNQSSTNGGSGQMRLECIVEAGYLYTGE